MRWFRRRSHEQPATPPNWQAAVAGALEHMARRYDLSAVEKDMAGLSNRFPAFKDEFWREVVRRL